MGHSESWQEGFEAGYEWFTENKGSAFKQKFGFGIPNKPFRSGDSEFNEGVADGIAVAQDEN